MQILDVPESNLSLCLIKEILSVSLEMLDNVEWRVFPGTGKSSAQEQCVNRGWHNPFSFLQKIFLPVSHILEAAACWFVGLYVNPAFLSLAWFSKGNCDFMWWLLRDKSAQQELSVQCGAVSVTAVIAAFGQMSKPRLQSLVHNLLFITFHRSRRGAQTHMWINILLYKVFNWCWANVLIFLGVVEPEERLLYSKGLWLPAVLQFIGEIRIQISSSPLTAGGWELHFGVCDAQGCAPAPGKSLSQPEQKMEKNMRLLRFFLWSS